jgi:tRNA(Ile)-lysidine synthase
MSRLKNKLLVPHEGGYRISIKRLHETQFKKALLYELLSTFQFPSHSITNILAALEGRPGKQFFSPTHRLVKDREHLIITQLKKDERRKHYLELDAGSIRHPINMDWVIIEPTPAFRIPSDPDTACLDLDRLDFPLILRHWQQGDYFQPLGMEGIKKLSDFFIDEKLSLPAKEQAWILCSGPAIVWIIGRRIDHRFRVTKATRQILMIRHAP